MRSLVGLSRNLDFTAVPSTLPFDTSGSFHRCLPGESSSKESSSKGSSTKGSFLQWIFLNGSLASTDPWPQRIPGHWNPGHWIPSHFGYLAIRIPSHSVPGPFGFPAIGLPLIGLLLHGSCSWDTLLHRW